MWKIAIPRPSGGQHFIMSDQCNRFTVRNPNRRHNETDPTAPWLYFNARRSLPHIQSKWHETGGTQWRLLPQQTKGTQQIGRPLLLIKRLHNTAKQRSSTQHIPHNKTCNVISDRSRIGGIIYYEPGGCIHQNHLGINGTQEAPHSTTNRKF